MLPAAAVRITPSISWSFSPPRAPARRRPDGDFFAVAVALVCCSSTVMKPALASTVSEASIASWARWKSSTAPSGMFANANWPSGPRVAVMPVPRTETSTPAGLVFERPFRTTSPEIIEEP